IGAGYLAKPDFIFVALPGCLWLLAARWRSGGRPAIYGTAGRLGIALILASVVASPYWVRNYKLFGDPLYTMTRLQRLGVHYLGFWPIYEIRYEKPFSYEEVVRKIGVKGILKRELDSIMCLRLLFRGTSGHLLILLAFCVAWKIRWSGEERDALILWASVFLVHYLFVVLYSLYEERYFWPYYPFACAFLAGISREFFRNAPRRRRMVYAFVLVYFLSGVGREAVTNTRIFFKNPWRIVEPMQWIFRNTAPGDVITAPMVMEMAFHTDRNAIHVPTGSVDAIIDTMDRFGSRYLVLLRDDDRDTVQELLNSGDPTGRLRKVHSGSFVVPYEPLGGKIDYQIMMRQ
ncbi:MAG: hypothetical protein P8123_01600, partial [bacterium]